MCCVCVCVCVCGTLISVDIFTTMLTYKDVVYCVFSTLRVLVYVSYGPLPIPQAPEEPGDEATPLPILAIYTFFFFYMCA